MPSPAWPLHFFRMDIYKSDMVRLQSHPSSYDNADVSRALFNALIDETNLSYAHLPPEDPDGGKGFCRRLNVHMYGDDVDGDDDDVDDANGENRWSGINNKIVVTSS